MGDKLLRILHHTNTTVPYYQKNQSNSLLIDSFPVIKKKDMQHKPADFMSNLYKKQDLIKLSTSGYSGEALVVYKTKGDYIIQLKNLWIKRKEIFNIEIKDKNLCLDFDYDPKWLARIDEDGRILHINIQQVNTNNFDFVENEISSFNPETMLVYPSLLMKLLSFYYGFGKTLPSNLSYIEFMGEYVTDRIAHLTNKCSLTQPCIASNYGTTEVFGIAYTCKLGRLHCISENAYIEVMKNGKISKFGEGEILITGLNSFAMPFIRYYVGDRGTIISGSSCACGDTNDIIHIHCGRVFEEFIINGTIYNTELFSHFYDRLSAAFDYHIHTFRIEHREKESFVVKMMINVGYSFLKDSIGQFFLSMLDENLRQCKWELVWLQEERNEGNLKERYYTRTFRNI